MRGGEEVEVGGVRMRGGEVVEVGEVRDEGWRRGGGGESEG